MVQYLIEMRKSNWKTLKIKLTKENEKAFTIHGVMCCAFADWLNLHTHFYKPVHAKLWYDKSQHYGDKGFTTEEVFKLFLEQHST